MNRLVHTHWSKKQEGFTPKKSKAISEQIRRACDKVLERTVKHREKYTIDGQTNYAKEIENYLANGGTVKVLPTCIASNTIQFEQPVSLSSGMGRDINTIETYFGNNINTDPITTPSAE